MVLLMTIANEVMKNRKYEAENYGATIATNIELLLNQYVSIVESLGDQYLEYGEDFAPSFPRICQHIMERDSTVGFLYIAPNGIIQMAYPQSVDEATIGLNRRKVLNRDWLPDWPLSQKRQLLPARTP